MKISAFHAFVVFALLVSSPSFADPLTFTFSFHDALFGGDVAGIVEGLENNSVQAATSVFVTSNSLGYGIGEYVGDTAVNLWIVANGQIVGVEFLSHGAFNTLPDVVCCSLFITDSPIASDTIIGGLTNLPTSLGANADSIVTFARVTAPATPVGVPIPHTMLILLVLGLVGLIFHQHRKKSLS
jgi:hypothetical protein